MDRIHTPTNTPKPSNDIWHSSQHSLGMPFGGKFVSGYPKSDHNNLKTIKFVLKLVQYYLPMYSTHLK